MGFSSPNYPEESSSGSTGAEEDRDSQWIKYHDDDCIGFDHNDADCPCRGAENLPIAVYGDRHSGMKQVLRNVRERRPELTQC